MPSLLQKIITRHPVAVMTTSVVLFMGVQAVFSFCGKKTCFAFNNADYDNWFPYKEKQTIVFASGSVTDTLNITTVERSKQEERSLGYGYNGCYPQALANGSFMKADSLGWASFYSACRLQENGTMPTGNFNFKGLSLAWQNIQDTGITISVYSGGIAYTSFQASTTLGGVLYTNVQIITPDESGKKSSGIANLYLAKTRGVVGFEEYPSGQLWIKQ